MSYLPEFKNDLFISYRRVANAGPDAWVTTFQNALDLSLKQLVGDSVQIWRDEEQLRTGDDWRGKLRDALDSTAIFLAIISRTYLEAPECINELDQMLAALRKDAGTRRRRIFPVYKQPPRKKDDVPSELRGLNHQEFFEPSAEAPLGFNELSAERDKLEFQRRLAWLAQAVTLALEELRDEALSRFTGKVFVADVEPGLYSERRGLAADLFDQRFRVVPDREYLWNSTDIEREILADLADARMAVHLVTPAGLPTAVEVELAQRQLRLSIDAMARQSRPPPVVWVGSRTNACPALVDFLREIDGPLADAGIEILCGGIEELKSLLYKRLAPPAPTASPSAPQAPAALPSAAAGRTSEDELPVLVEQGDYEAFGPTRALLVRTFGIEAVPVRLEGASPRDPALLAGTLAGSRRCLIFWGAQPEEWLQQVMRQPALAGHLGCERLAVLAAAPDTTEKQQFISRKASLLHVGADAEWSAFLGPAMAAAT